jgi:drug/metabolite transporter (DMT)-like permease
MNKPASNLLPYLALTLVSLIWGTTYLVLRMGVTVFPPFLFVAIRQVIAGALLLAALYIAKTPLRLSAGHLVRQTVAGFFMITLGNGLVAWSEVYIPSGVAAVLCSLLPMAVLLVNLCIYRVNPSARVVAGTAIGLLGILLLFSEHVADLVRREYQLGVLCTLLAVLSWAAGSVWLKAQNASDNPFSNAAWQMLTGGLLCLPLSWLFDAPGQVVFSIKVIYALAYLIVFGSVLAYASYLYALRTLPLAVVSLYAYINPIVAVVLGWLVLDEKLNLQIGMAVALVLVGILLVNKGYRPGGLRQTTK